MHDLELDYAADELRYNRMMEPVYRHLLTALGLPRGTRGLDAGCGPGGLFHSLIEATGGSGEIVGVDASAAHRAAAEREVARQGLRERVRVEEADLQRPLPFADATFDWVWCADVLWRSLVPDPVATVREFRRVVKPGGVVAVFFYDHRGVILPGHPDLEHRLNTAAFRHYGGGPRDDAARHEENALGWLIEAGLLAPRVASHVADDWQPLRPATFDYLANYWFPDRRDRISDDEAAAAGIDTAEWRSWRDRLANPDAAAYLPRQHWYRCVQGGTMAVGRVPAGP